MKEEVMRPPLPSRKSWTALVADDSVAVRRLVCARLRQDGCEAGEAADGFDALQQLKHSTPDVLIVDDVLPGLSGVELVQAVHTHGELGALKILFLVEYRSGLRRAALAGLSEAAVIWKPFDLDDVAERVAAIRLAG
jgi:CheY-like chemotaxis protein